MPEFGIYQPLEKYFIIGGRDAGISGWRKFKFKPRIPFRFDVIFRYQKLILAPDDLFSVGKETFEERKRVSWGHDFFSRGKKHGEPIKHFFFFLLDGRATGRVTTMANNNTLLLRGPIPQHRFRDDYPRVTRCTGWFIAIIFLFSGSPPVKWAVGSDRRAESESARPRKTAVVIRALSRGAHGVGKALRRYAERRRPRYAPHLSTLLDPIPSRTLLDAFPPIR